MSDKSSYTQFAYAPDSSGGRLPTGASRQRNYRLRQKSGVIVVPVEVAPEAADALVEHGLLSMNSVEDRAAITRAIRALLNGLAASMRDA